MICAEERGACTFGMVMLECKCLQLRRVSRSKIGIHMLRSTPVCAWAANTIFRKANAETTAAMLIVVEARRRLHEQVVEAKRSGKAR
jgi:hypothetical protein